MKKTQDWNRLISEQRGSGLSIMEFCRRRGVSPSGFYRQLSRTAPAGKPESRFVEALVSDRDLMLELQGAGWSVKVPTNLPSSELTRILRAIGEAL
jgi:hypothetical protein